MAISNSKPHLFPVIFKAFFLLLLLKKVKSHSVSFTFPNFWSDVSDNITFQGDVKSTTGILQLTKTDENGNPLTSSAGRAVYSELVHLWDHETGSLASFYTNFNFELKTTSNAPADGLAFFLAPKDSDVKDYGGVLGLFRRDTATQPSKNQVVAVEFDTWGNREWTEPSYRHIGIDVNSIVSVATKKWEDSDFFSGNIATVHISYDASSKILTAILSYPDGGDYTLSSVVDLSANLPEWVIVGFSAATGPNNVETHNILSWHFSSTLQNTSTSAAKKQHNIRTVV